ncbi:site-specific DNA-methyltransferase (adenine-specific) [Alphaproteobacteria bacterium]|nr:site-specific DNA-methyltransferase (adenine-specific) [Alphaproteobacteria bacterium]
MGCVNKPFLKWAGGKYRILDRILRELPSGARLVEPFAGSCAVYLNAPFAEALVCDLNSDLISLYQHLQQEGEAFIQYCASFFIPQNNRREVYLELRARFNASTEARERAALLLYVNRHAFNGLIRYNSKGGFNVPFGRYAKPYFPREELRLFQRKAQSTETVFLAEDFRAVFAALQPGDVVYCDPPYAPLSPSASFTSYAGNVFDTQDQQDLAQLAQDAWRKGIPVILSNHDTPLTRRLYSTAIIKRFEVQRFISRNGDNRELAPELLAVYGQARCRRFSGKPRKRDHVGIALVKKM